MRFRVDWTGRPWSRRLLRVAFEAYLLAVMALFAALAYLAAQQAALVLGAR